MPIICCYGNDYITAYCTTDLAAARLTISNINKVPSLEVCTSKLIMVAIDLKIIKVLELKRLHTIGVPLHIPVQ